jgi:hypothetical protein
MAAFSIEAINPKTPNSNVPRSRGSIVMSFNVNLL